MAAATNIVLADAQATPVNHTFIPLGPLNNWDMVFEDQSRPSPVGFWRIYVRLKRPTEKMASGNVAVTLSLQEPVLETISVAASGLTQAPTVAYVPRCDVEFRVSNRSTLQDRKDLRKMAALLLADAQIIPVVENFVPLY